MIAIDLSKQQALDADTKAIQQVNFTANLDSGRNTRIYFVLEEVKETVSDFSQRTVKVCECNSIEWFNFYQYKNDTKEYFKRKAIKFTV